MNIRLLLVSVLSVPLAACASDHRSAADGSTAAGANTGGPPVGWLHWRGPHQAGTSDETSLIETVEVDGLNHLWDMDLPGRGTPVIAGNRVYTMGYAGEGADLQELLVCLDADTGRPVWKHGSSDFISDIIYNRYAIGSPTVDPDTGNVFCLTTPGLLKGFTAGGELLWERSMMEAFGRFTFPNGRTGAPVIDGERVIVHVITSSWGKQGPARDRLFAFDKTSGELIWTSTPGDVPKDSSFCPAVLAWEDGRRVLYTGTGCGRLVCVDARTGEPLWAFRMSIGGLNSAPVLFEDTVIAIHGRENLDASNIGRLIAVERGRVPEPGAGPIQMGAGDELWRNDDLVAFTSSPVLVGDRYYETTQTGELNCVDASDGRRLWHEKLAPDQIHASPAWGDGKLYVPMNNGSFHIIRPTDAGPERLCTVQLEGNCLGAPAIAGGRIYVHTTEKLYCFGTKTTPVASRTPGSPQFRPGPATRLQVIPAEAVLRPGERIPMRLRALDEKGNTLSESEQVYTAQDVPGAKVVTHESRGLTGTQRVRVVPDLPLRLDFEGTELTVPDKARPGQKFAFPPSYWLSARPKWKIIEQDDGDLVISRRMDNSLFQRTQSLFGHPGDSEYTMTMDVLSDGTRRSMSSPGMVNQRYLIVLKGNHQTLEISSNMERIKESVRYRWKPGTWYTLKSRVENRPDGSTLVRAKVWERDAPEPDAWTLEVEHANGHTHGSAGLYGFTPQSRFTIYVDNIAITPNEDE